VRKSHSFILVNTNPLKTVVFVSQKQFKNKIILYFITYYKSLRSVVTDGREVLVLGMGLEPTILGLLVRCSTNRASRAIATIIGVQEYQLFKHLFLICFTEKNIFLRTYIRPTGHWPNLLQKIITVAVCVCPRHSKNGGGIKCYPLSVRASVRYQNLVSAQ